MNAWLLTTTYDVSDGVVHAGGEGQTFCGIKTDLLTTSPKDYEACMDCLLAIPEGVDAST